MNIVLDSTSNLKSSKSKLQARFDKLQQQLLKQQKLNRKFQQDLDELVTMYQTQIAQADNALIEPLTRLASKLIGFYGRKSLAQWQREELEGWIIEILQRIARVEPETAQELRSRVRQVIASQCGMTEAELEEELQRHIHAFEETLESDSSDDTQSASEETFSADDVQEDMFGFDDVFGEDDAADERFFNGDDPFGKETGDVETRRQRLMDGSWVRSLFRRAAQALHPDRESDPEQRQAKERSMQQLLEARRQGDVMTLLQLYSECIDGDELVLAEREMTSACELMEEQLHAVRAEKTAFIYEHPLRMLVHDLFYTSSKKTREKRIQAWKQDLKASAEQTFQLVEELRNLKVLKMVLEERRDEQLLDELDAIFNGQW